MQPPPLLGYLTSSMPPLSLPLLLQVSRDPMLWGWQHRAGSDMGVTCSPDTASWHSPWPLTLAQPRSVPLCQPGLSWEVPSTSNPSREAHCGEARRWRPTGWAVWQTV